MGELPEGRQPLAWNDMPLADRPRGHPSTERLEIEKLRARVAKLEAALKFYRDQNRIAVKPTIDAEWAQTRLKTDAGARAAAALQEGGE